MTIDFLRIELEPEYMGRTHFLTLRVSAQVNGTMLNTFIQLDEDHFEAWLDQMLRVAGDTLKRLAKAEKEKQQGPRTREEIERAIREGLGMTREDAEAKKRGWA